ncbi:MAG: hypothetical protein GY856_23680 [bacterium]|nr:hypothetical protein [bacterium]
MRRKRWLGLLVCLVLPALVAGHFAYWYLPRVRAGSPRSGSLVTQLLHSPQYPVAVWVPYPHQNLAYLERVTANGEEVRLSAARLAGLPRPMLPAFGPLSVPPASEIAVASDETGERFAVFAQVYPAVAAFAKLAGRLAGNPWLQGGRVSVDGRRAEVGWRGNVWTVTSSELPSLAAAPPAPVPPSLMVMEVRRAVAPLPAGRFRLLRDGAALELRSQDAVPSGVRFREEQLSQLGLFLLIFSGRQELGDDPRQALAFFSQDDVNLELPRAAALFEPGARRWSLPGEDLLDLVGREPRAAEVSGWSLAALDSVSLERARRLAPHLVPLTADGPADRMAWGLWLELDGLLAEVSRIVNGLDGVPLVSRRRVERWRDAETVLTPLARRYSRLSLVVTEQPSALRLRIEGRGGASEDR